MSHFHLLLILILFTGIHGEFLLKVTKDSNTHQYTTELLMGEPQVPTKLLVHLSGDSIWLNCLDSRKFIKHGSLPCLMNKPYHQNPVTGVGGMGELAEDVISSASDIVGYLKFRIMFTCSKEYLLQGLVNGARGVLGLGGSKAAFQSQVVNSFDIPRRFSVCLSKSVGFIVSGTHVSNRLSYTQVSRTRGNGYHVNVNSVKINGRRLAIGKAIGGVEISSVFPYTTMESSVYETFTKAYVTSAKMMNLTFVEPVAPFGVCFSTQAKVPEIELVFQSELVKWKIQRRNVMVDVSDSVMCLGFVDGGLDMNGLMVLGGYQLEDHILEFNLGSNMMGFSSSLLREGNSCSKLRESISTPEESL